MTSWREERRETDRIERLDVPSLHDRAQADGGLQILDVREQAEWDAGHIAGALFGPYHDLHELPEGLDPVRPVAAICSSGQRAAVAASLLRRQGAERVIHVVDGGVGTWARRGWPIESSAG